MLDVTIRSGWLMKWERRVISTDYEWIVVEPILIHPSLFIIQ